MTKRKDFICCSEKCMFGKCANCETGKRVCKHGRKGFERALNELEENAIVFMKAVNL